MGATADLVTETVCTTVDASVPVTDDDLAYQIVLRRRPDAGLAT